MTEALDRVLERLERLDDRIGGMSDALTRQSGAVQHMTEQVRGLAASVATALDRSAELDKLAAVQASRLEQLGGELQSQRVSRHGLSNDLHAVSSRLAVVERRQEDAVTTDDLHQVRDEVHELATQIGVMGAAVRELSEAEKQRRKVMLLGGGVGGGLVAGLIEVIARFFGAAGKGG